MNFRSWSIVRDSPIPIYYQLEEFIQGKIERGEWKDGTQIPTEKEICAHLEVSRSVVRQALSDLVDQGLLYRVPGKGTFVASPKISEGLIQSLTGFHEDMTERGLDIETRVLRQELVPAYVNIAKKLKVDRDTKLICIMRLRGIDGKKLTLSTTYIPYDIAPDLLEEDLSNISIYSWFEVRGFKIKHADRVIEAVAADEEDAFLLGVDVGSPLLMMTNTSYLEDGTPFEHYIAKHTGERSKLEVRLVREK